METVEFTAIKSKVMFPKAGHKDGDFAIISVELKDIINGNVPVHRQYGTITIKGSLPKMENSVYRIIGNLEYSEQYKSYSIDVLHVDKYVENLDLDKFEDFIQYVMTESELKLLRKVPNTKEVLDNGDIDELTKVKGIGKRKAKTILAKYNQDRSVILHKVKLAKYGVTDGLINKLLDKYKSFEVIISKVEENPYLLTEDNIFGVGFKSIDKIALTMNIEPTDHRRVRAYVIYKMREEMFKGNTFAYTTIFLEQLYSELYGNEEVDKAVISMVFAHLFADNTLWRDEDKSRIALTYIRNIEYKLVEEIKRLDSGIRKDNIINWELTVKKIEEEQGWEYTSEQLSGIESLLDDNNTISVITAPAGCGKTSVLKPLTRILVEQQGKKIMQVAPTGRAAQRMAEVTGYPASTIHRLLGFKGGSFEYNRKNKLKGIDILVIDEASMIDARLFLALLEALEDGVKICIVGDSYQLQSIGISSVLLDLIETKAVNIISLTKIQRQAQASGIVSASVNVRNNKQIQTDYKEHSIIGELKDFIMYCNDEVDYILQKTLKCFEESLEETGNIMDTQVGVMMRTRGKLCSFNINNLIKEIYNPIKSNESIAECQVDTKHKYLITKNDKIIITKNDYSATLIDEETEETYEGQIFNGNMGVVKEIGIDYMIVELQDIGLVEIDSTKYGSVELAYAISIHKSQGSEFKHFIVACSSESYMMLNSSLLYTAITRARKKCWLVGQEYAIKRCCYNKEGIKKLSFLQEFLLSN